MSQVAAAAVKPLIDWPLLAAVGISLVAATLRIQPLNESLWADELHTAWCAAGPLNEVAPRAAIGNQAPLFFWLEWFAAGLPGIGEISLRLISFLSGSLQPLAVFFLARRWSTAGVGLVAATLIAVDAGGIFYSTEARPYALLQLVAIGHIAIALELFSRPSLPLRMSWVAVGAVLFYLHYTAALIVLAELVAWALATLIRPTIVAYFGIPLAIDLALLGVICLPAAGSLGIVFARRGNWAAFVASSRPQAIFDWWPCALGVAFAIPHLTLNYFREQDDNPSTSKSTSNLFLLVLVCWLLIPCVAAWGVSELEFAKLFYQRYLLVCAPAAVLLAACCASFAPWRWGKIVIGLLLIAAGIHASEIYPRLYHERRVIAPRGEDWRGCIAWLNKQLETTQFPVLVSSGLIEADELRQPHDELLEDYCLAPVLSLYPLDIERGDLFPLPQTEPGNLDQVAEMLTIHRGGAWLIVRGDKKKGTAVANEIVVHLQNTAAPESEMQWHVGEARQFGRVQALLIKSNSANPAPQHDLPIAAP